MKIKSQHCHLLFAMVLIANSFFTTGANAQSFQKDTVIQLLPNESWWGGWVADGYKMPFGKTNITADLYGNVSGNQASPLLLSSQGRWVWADEPFRFGFANGQLSLSKLHSPIETGKTGTSLKDAYAFLSKARFPSSGIWPDSLLITSPQYNLWVELMYSPNQKDVMNYAHKVIANGFPPGVLMIDDNWSKGYGSFVFDKEKFPDPKQMTDSLHNMGFKVMLWICPFISPDGENFRWLEERKLLLLDNEGDPAKTVLTTTKPFFVHWWNGYSACLDLYNAKAIAWLEQQLDNLQSRYGVDGFKFDAGDASFYASPNIVSIPGASPNGQTAKWAEMGLKYKLNEYRAMWKMGGQPLVQRLSDKGHSWSQLKELIPNTIAQHLMGYTFTCPDMVGGGEFTSFLNASTIDQDLVVRSAECHALMPMMQFSAAPWRILDSTHLAAIKKTVALRQQFIPYIMQTMRLCAQTGEPVVRALEYSFPHQQLENIRDQFMLGEKYMVAPVLEKSGVREVVFPQGKWKYKSTTIKGGTTKSFSVPLDELLVFEKL